jgi:hypothetical protein
LLTDIYQLLELSWICLSWSFPQYFLELFLTFFDFCESVIYIDVLGLFGGVDSGDSFFVHHLVVIVVVLLYLESGAILA